MTELKFCSLSVLMNAHKLRKKVAGKRPFLTLWYIFNIGMAVFYGFVHQVNQVYFLF